MAFGAGAQKPEKHMPYYKMLDRFGLPGCPVCSMVQSAVDGYLDSLLYESVNDRPLRARFARDRGLCNRHVHHLAPRGDGLGLGILYREIFAQAIRALGGDPASGHSGAGQPAGAPGVQDSASRSAAEPESAGPEMDFCPDLPLNRGSCAVCDFERDTEARMLSLFVAFRDDEEFRDRFEGSEGLCIPHLARLAEAMPRGNLPGWMAGLHRRRFGAYLAELDDFLESFNATSDRFPRHTEGAGSAPVLPETRTIPEAGHKDTVQSREQEAAWGTEGTGRQPEERPGGTILPQAADHLDPELMTHRLGPDSGFDMKAPESSAPSAARRSLVWKRIPHRAAGMPGLDARVLSGKKRGLFLK
jgi:hypothetical protein